MVFGDTVTVFRQQGALSWEQSCNRTLMAGLCLPWHTRIVYDRLVVAVVCMCVCMHLLHHLNYAAISQPVIQSSIHPASQPVSQPGPDRVKQQAGKQSEPQWQCKQTTVRPHRNHTAPCHLQSCIWLPAGRERKEGRRESIKEKGRRQGRLVGWWLGWRTKKEKSRKGREDKRKRVGERDEVLLKR